ncbi:MAG TPA: hypothetical protein VGN63_19520 [Flavisolibacter sp.]|jgi:hypothetical protein|nr:hypothetical protein [Flavisolibacter sp.]
MKNYFDITISPRTEPALLRNYLNKFKGIEANVIDNKVRIWYTAGIVSEKFILKLVGSFNRQKTGTRTKVTSVTAPQIQK